MYDGGIEKLHKSDSEIQDWLCNLKVRLLE